MPITITIWSLPFDELRWTTFTDSGFDTGERQRHQQGWLLCSTNKYFNQERTAPVSVLHWRSRKTHPQRRGGPQLVETYAASSAMVEMTWIRALWESMTWRDLDILTQRRSRKPLKNLTPHVIRRIQSITTPRALLSRNPMVCSMHWTTICLKMTGSQLWRWRSLRTSCAVQCVDLVGVQHNRNAADALTKFKGAHSEPWFNLLRTGMYTLKGEKNELADRARQRQTGTVPRHKVSATRAATETLFLFIRHLE